MSLPGISRTPHAYQLKLIPPVAPPPPLAAPPAPKKTASSFFPVSVAAHAPNNNDAARTRTGTAEAIPLTEKNAIVSVVDSLFGVTCVFMSVPL